MGPEQEHIAENNGWPGEGRGYANEKKTEMFRSTCSDGGDPYAPLPACVTSQLEASAQLVARREDRMVYM